MQRTGLKRVKLVGEPFLVGILIGACSACFSMVDFSFLDYTNLGFVLAFVFFFFNLSSGLPLANSLCISTSTRGREIKFESLPATLMKKFSETQEWNVS